MFDDLNNSPAPGNLTSVPQSNNPAQPTPGSFIPTPPAGNQAPANSSAKAAVEDIFLDTEPVKPAVFQRPADPNGTQTASPEDIIPSRIPKAVLIGIVAVSGLALLGYGGFWGYNFYKNQGTAPVVENLEPETEAPVENAVSPVVEQQIPATTNENSAPATTNNAVTEQPSPAATVDSDQDGLPDDEELKLGTNPNNTDSDSDGLYDREEVYVYKTNPAIPDTDGDGYKDGAEVQGGYNPSGPGKLYEKNN